LCSDAPASGTTVADLCKNIAYRINTDADPSEPTAYVAAAVGDIVYLSRGTSTDTDLPLSILIDMINGTTTEDSVASTLAVTPSPLSVNSTTVNENPKRTTYITVTVKGGVAPFLYSWVQIGTTAVFAANATSAKTHFAANRSDITAAGGVLTAQFYCEVTDKNGLRGRTVAVSARLTS
jgi:hypothetical protein